MAEDFDGEPEAEFWLAAGNRVGRWCNCPGVWLPRDLLVGLPDSVRICGVHGGVGILSRRESDSRAIRRYVYGLGGGSHHEQYAALWRLYRSHGDGVRLYRAVRRGFQPRLA